MPHIKQNVVCILANNNVLTTLLPNNIIQVPKIEMYQSNSNKLASFNLLWLFNNCVWSHRTFYYCYCSYYYCCHRQSDKHLCPHI